MKQLDLFADPNTPIFKFAIHTSGSLHASYVFENEEQIREFKEVYVKFVELVYGPITLREESLPGLEIGDTCLCVGEGDDELVIQDIHQDSTWQWSFGLSHGCWENVAKCWKKIE